ncbi:hypothetical protein HXX76_014349 [Chlamydomonas incerta]|uniref:Uncharacterized protein n=1 Tax=Chlamydomonas incerta TaxID=51695 RepID=A0A835SLT0_CHLIN|nr:hypothetical protein HXX76_014349 [Chlamydomonas incerta]|eukprot:KAG2424624.1 hypothetical protein HXX76_014349 [Chlamydomonas incerta]
MATQLRELRPLLLELSAPRRLATEGEHESTLLAIESALRTFLAGAERCRNCGPLETLLTAAPLHLGMVDACLCLGKALTPLQRPELPTVVAAQAKLLAVELEKTTPSFASLRRLAMALSELQEEAERARLGDDNNGAFTALVTRLTVRCPRAQLAADAAFLAQQVQEATAAGRNVEAHFFQLASTVVQALLPALPLPSPAAGAASDAARGDADRAAAAGTPGGTPRRSSAAAGERGARASATGAAMSSRRRRLQLGTDENSQAEACASVGAASCSGDVGAMVDRLCNNSTSHAERVAALEAVCEAVTGPKHKEAAQALERAGMGQLLRLVVSSNRAVRAATLRLLGEMLRADPDGCAQQQLVAARGLSVLVHQVVTSLDEGGLQCSAVAAALAAGEAGMGHVDAQHVAVVAAASPAGKGLGTGTPKKGHGALEVASPRPEPVSPSPLPGPPALAREESGVSEEELCVLAIALLRHILCGPHMAELMSAGAVKALCRCAALPSGGRVVSAAMAALADAAQDGSAAVQMLQERLLVTLADLALSPRASEAGLAYASFAALMHHPARLAAEGIICSNSSGSASSSTSGDGNCAGASSSPQQLCVEMGRACDAASTTVLLDLVVGDVGGSSDIGDWRSLVPAAVHLLPACLHSPENRAAALRQGAALRRLLRPLAAGDAGAAAVLRRLGGSLDQTKPAVVRLLAQALVEGSSSVGRGGSGAQQSAQLALALADVLRPVGSRDRAALRWAGEACSEAEGCGAVRAAMDLTASNDMSCRTAGVACLHALAVYGSASTRAALGAAGCVPALVDAVKLEAKALPEPALAPPICSPHTVGHAASEALAALAGSDKMRRDICVQLCAFAGSSSLGLAAAACGALLLLLAEVPAAGPILAEVGVMEPLVGQLARSPGPSTKAGRDPYRMSVALHGGVGSAASSSNSHGTGTVGGEDVLELVQQRAVRLLWALCRGGGSAVDAAVAARAASPLLQRLSPALDVTLRVEAAAALGPLVRKSAAARDEVVAHGGLALLLELARGAPTNVPLWEDACAALAALVAMHAPTRAEATRVLRQMLVRGPTRSEVAAAAVVVARMATGPAGREAALAEDVVEPLVRLLGLGDDRTKAAAADAIYHLAVAGTVQLPPCTALPNGGPVKPRVALIRAGAVPALLALMDAPSEHAAAAPASPGPAAAVAGTEAGGMLPVAVLLPVAEALECLAGSDEGVQAIKAAGGVQVLKDTVARGKRRLVPQEVAKAASDALLQCM